MSRMKVKIDKFTDDYAGLNGDYIEFVSLPQFVWAALSFGPQYFAPSAMHHAVMLACYKVFAIDLAVEFRQGGITRRDSYSLLDPSEKGNVSFWLGMSMATWMAQRYLGISHLHHAEAMRRWPGRLDTVPAGRSLADFVGIDSNGLPHVIEAKGRQAKPSAKDRKRFKKQASSIRRVDGVLVATRSYSVVWGASQLKACLIDPPLEDDDAVDITLPEGRGLLVRSFYDPFTVFLDARGSAEVELLGVPVRLRRAGVLPMSEQSLWVGLRSDLAGDSGGRPSERRVTAAMGTEEEAYIGANGVACFLGDLDTMAEVTR